MFETKKARKEREIREEERIIRLNTKNVRVHKKNSDYVPIFVEINA